MISLRLVAKFGHRIFSLMISTVYFYSDRLPKQMRYRTALLPGQCVNELEILNKSPNSKPKILLFRSAQECSKRHPKVGVSSGKIWTLSLGLFLFNLSKQQ